MSGQTTIELESRWNHSFDASETTRRQWKDGKKMRIFSETKDLSDYDYQIVIDDLGYDEFQATLRRYESVDNYDWIFIGQEYVNQIINGGSIVVDDVILSKKS